MRQNPGWAIGYSSLALALPIAAGVFEPRGLTARPEIAAITMAGSSIIVALNALALKRLRLRLRGLAPEDRSASCPSNAMPAAETY
jgi:P-type Cu2+ transporter